MTSEVENTNVEISTTNGVPIVNEIETKEKMDVNDSAMEKINLDNNSKQIELNTEENNTEEVFESINIDSSEISNEIDKVETVTETITEVKDKVNVEIVSEIDNISTEATVTIIEKNEESMESKESNESEEVNQSIEFNESNTSNVINDTPSTHNSSNEETVVNNNNINIGSDNVQTIVNNTDEPHIEEMVNTELATQFNGANNELNEWLEKENIDYSSLSKEELIKKINNYKEEFIQINKKSENKLRDTKSYIVRLEEATEQRLERMKKQNQEEIDEMKKISDKVIKIEKEKAQKYVIDIKKNVDDEREVLRQIEIDSRSRFQKEKEEKIEAHEEINRLNHVIAGLNEVIEGKNMELANLEEKNLSIFVQKEKEIEQVINQVDMEKQNYLTACQKINELNNTIESLNDKIGELNDELCEFKNESKIRKSQLNLLNVENEQLQKKVKNLNQKNEELNNLYELQMDETSGLKSQIERLTTQLEHLKRKKIPRMSVLSPMTPFSACSNISGNSSFIVNDERRLSIHSSFSTDSSSGRRASKASVINEESFASKSCDSIELNSKITDIVEEPINETSDMVIINKNENGPEEDHTNSVTTSNNDGIIKLNDDESTIPLEEIELNDSNEIKDSQGMAAADKMLRSLTINTDITVNEEVEVEEDDEEEGEEINAFEYEQQQMNGMVKKPLVYHPNNKMYINFCESLHEDYSKIYTTKLVKQCELEEIVQCLDFNGTYIGFFNKRKLLNGLKNNTLVIEKGNMDKLVVDTAESELKLVECVLCDTKCNINECNNEQMNWYQFYYDDEKNSVSEWICMFCRERLVATCNWYKYLSMVQKKIIKQDIDSVYINCLHLKENMYHARNGLLNEEDSSLMTLSMANLSNNDEMNSSFSVKNMNEFVDININDENDNNNTLDFDNSSNASTTIHNSEFSDYQVMNTSNVSTPKDSNNNAYPVRKRSSICYVNDISKKMSMSSTPNTTTTTV